MDTCSLQVPYDYDTGINLFKSYWQPACVGLGTSRQLSQHYGAQGMRVPWRVQKVQASARTGWLVEIMHGRTGGLLPCPQPLMQVSKSSSVGTDGFKRTPDSSILYTIISCS